ncbi:MAG: TonB-dependent receptor, partial [Xanthobacteraceae bacterium]|nr:TonB-dependent receptor [Xanthobacteraceae bacterium]
APRGTAGARSASASGQSQQQQAAAAAAAAIDREYHALDAARAALMSTAGAGAYTLTESTIAALPQGSETPIDKVLLQAPGVSQDSAASGSLHVRNEHANVQTRIDGIMLPDGVSAFGQIIDTRIIGSLSLVTGALPAQYGLRTSGVLDITTRAGAFDNSGSVSVYGGSHGTVTPSFEYGGTVGGTQYFVSGRYFGGDLGLENPTSSRDAIHDHTDQGKGFVYLSTRLDDASRLVFIGGTSTSNFQIPNNPGQPPGASANGVPFVGFPFSSANLNEHQFEDTQFGVAAYQTSRDGLDLQLAYFSRLSSLHFVPDVAGDLAFNGVASDVVRKSLINGIEADGSYRLTDSHTLRFGLQSSAERSQVGNTSTLIPADAAGDPTGAPPFTVDDTSSKLGWLFSAYASDEWKITRQLTLTAGLRFDQMWSYTDANQLSPRVNLAYAPVDGTTFHAGYARNFTPPSQVLAAPTNLALVQGTTQQPAVNRNDPVLPERSNVFDVGVTQQVFKGFEVGIDAYYKTAKDLIDDGQFGAAYVLAAFNYAHGENEGVELTAKYRGGGFDAYANVSIAKQIATTVVSNQYLFGADELAYIASHYVYTDHNQFVSGSAGLSYSWQGTKVSADMIYGSGLREGFANTGSLPFYTQVNLGVSHEFDVPWARKPLTVRFDIVNVLDSVYEIRDGSGIGVFAPQFGPRRGFFAGLSQKL